MIELIERHREQLIALCRRYGVSRLDLFGSAAKGSFEPQNSDLDFIAHFERTREPGYAERFYYFAESLEALFQRRVDVLTERMIRNPIFREEVERTRQVIYHQTTDEQGSTQTTG